MFLWGKKMSAKTLIGTVLKLYIALWGKKTFQQYQAFLSMTILHVFKNLIFLCNILLFSMGQYFAVFSVSILFQIYHYVYYIDAIVNVFFNFYCPLLVYRYVMIFFHFFSCNIYSFFLFKVIVLQTACSQIFQFLKLL